jgi:hypothetical protein
LVSFSSSGLGFVSRSHANQNWQTGTQMDTAHRHTDT